MDATHDLETPQERAQRLIDLARELGARVLSMKSGHHFCLVTDLKIADKLVAAGARNHCPPGMTNPDGGYMTASDGVREWDLNLGTP